MQLKPLLDIHTHTLVSGHAYSTLKENLDEAKRVGLKVLGTSDTMNMVRLMWKSVSSTVWTTLSPACIPSVLRIWES